MPIENTQNIFSFRTKDANELLEGSKPIDFDVALPLLNAYKTHTAKLYVNNGGANSPVLKGLRFDRSDIEALLTGNVTHLFLMFAVKPGEPDYLTIVAGGVTDPDDTGGILNKNLLYDYCEPCPNKCPNNL